MNDKQFEKTLPEWAIKARDHAKKLSAENFMLWLELDRMKRNEELYEETNEVFSEWTDSFFKENGLKHLIKPYHKYISKKLDEEDL